MTLTLLSNVGCLRSPAYFSCLTPWSDFQSHFKEIARQHSPEPRRIYVHLTSVTVRPSLTLWICVSRETNLTPRIRKRPASPFAPSRREFYVTAFNAQTFSRFLYYISCIFAVSLDYCLRTLLYDFTLQPCNNSLLFLFLLIWGPRNKSGVRGPDPDDVCLRVFGAYSRGEYIKALVTPSPFPRDQQPPRTALRLAARPFQIHRSRQRPRH